MAEANVLNLYGKDTFKIGVRVSKSEPLYDSIIIRINKHAMIVGFVSCECCSILRSRTWPLPCDGTFADAALNKIVRQSSSRYIQRQGGLGNALLYRDRLI